MSTSVKQDYIYVVCNNSSKCYYDLFPSKFAYTERLKGRLTKLVDFTDCVCTMDFINTFKECNIGLHNDVEMLKRYITCVNTTTAKFNIMPRRYDNSTIRLDTALLDKLLSDCCILYRGFAFDTYKEFYCMLNYIYANDIATFVAHYYNVKGSHGLADRNEIIKMINEASERLHKAMNQRQKAEEEYQLMKKRKKFAIIPKLFKTDKPNIIESYDDANEISKSPSFNFRENKVDVSTSLDINLSKLIALIYIASVNDEFRSYLVSTGNSQIEFYGSGGLSENPNVTSNNFIGEVLMVLRDIIKFEKDKIPIYNMFIDPKTNITEDQIYDDDDKEITKGDLLFADSIKRYFIGKLREYAHEKGIDVSDFDIDKNELAKELLNTENRKYIRTSISPRCKMQIVDKRASLNPNVLNTEYVHNLLSSPNSSSSSLSRSTSRTEMRSDKHQSSSYNTIQ